MFHDATHDQIRVPVCTVHHTFVITAACFCAPKKDFIHECKLICFNSFQCAVCTLWFNIDDWSYGRSNS